MNIKGRFFQTLAALREINKNLKTRIRYLKGKLSGQTPVLVYQMGKVGSTSLRRSLIRQYSGYTAHAHIFTKESPKYEIRLMHKYYKTGEKIKIISMVREPIERNISAFFQDIELYTHQIYTPGEVSFETLRNKFLLTFPHYSTIDWFDDNLKKHLNLDIYKYEFPSSGSMIVTKGPIELLLYKYDLIQTQREHLIASFLNLKEFNLSKENVTLNKSSGNDYSKFREKIKLPEFIIEKMRFSQYYNHFYSEKEINESLSKYMK